MSRDMYDRTAAEWAAVVDAVRKAGGDTIALPTDHLTLIFHGYEQLQTERAAALALLTQWEQQGLTDTFAGLHMRHALGDISNDVWDEHVRAASNQQTEEGK